MNPPGSRGNFYIAYAYCSRFPCTATFALYIKEKPRDTASTFTVRVRYEYFAYSDESFKPDYINEIHFSSLVHFFAGNLEARLSTTKMPLVGD